jgi:predicted short-subunit dehydrogenase-like oxidoreductase (DUF2520 family)
LSCSNAEQLSSKIAAEYICDIEHLDTNVDLIIFAVKDEVVKDLSAFVIRKNPEVNMVHTSGSIGLGVFEGASNTGVFYPLQSFSKTKALEVSKVPILISAQNVLLRDNLIALAKTISSNVYAYSEDQLKHLHIAAVLVNNFSNHLFALAQDYCELHQLDYQLLLPLIQETIHKIEYLAPKNAQTGPARRGDSVIVENHLQLLQKEDESLYFIYKLLTESILKMYSKNV